jgi:Uma2 family endonuclease
MTAEEFLALPDDGVERWLIRGEVRELPMTTRNRWHSRVTARVAQLLGNWLDQRPAPRGEVYAGDAGFILQRDPDSTVGIDVAYASAELAAREPDNTRQMEGVPTLAVEILSPSNTQEEIDEKLDLYREVRVPLVWLINPRHRTVTVFRPDAEPVLFNVTQELTAEPHLPGFRIPVAQIFSR